MALVRVDVKDHYGIGELWSSAGNESAAVQEAERWCEANPPWVVRSPQAVRGEDGHYKVVVERAYQIA